MKLKTRELVLLSLLLSACGGGGSNSADSTLDESAATGSQTPGSTTDASDPAEGPVVNSPAGNSAAGLSCRSQIDPVDQTHDVVLFDAPDYEAFENLRNSSMDTLGMTEQAAAGFAYSSLSVTQIEALGIFAAALYCDYERYEDNQCQNSLANITSAEVTAGVLSYTYSDADGSIVTTVMISDTQYSSGSYRRTDGEGKVTDYIWSRDSDGTERFNMSASDGSSSGFVEHADCSGNASRVYVLSNGQPGMTTNASWTSPIGGGFSASFETCNFIEDSPGCTSFTP